MPYDANLNPKIWEDSTVRPRIIEGQLETVSFWEEILLFACAVVDRKQATKTILPTKKK